MTSFNYSLCTTDTSLRNMGLLVLQSDETIEHDFQRLMSPQVVKLYTSRVPSCLEISTHSLTELAHNLPMAAGLFPSTKHMHVVGFACTSAASVIGATEVTKLVQSACNCTHVTNPLSALIAACGHLDVKQLALLSPYVEEVADGLRTALEKEGINTSVFGSFEEAQESRVANIDKNSIIDAALELARDTSVEAIFLSCTNLKTLDVIADIEARISKPVLSSNTVLAWHMCHLAGIGLHAPGFGLLLDSSKNA